MLPEMKSLSHVIVANQNEIHVMAFDGAHTVCGILYETFIRERERKNHQKNWRFGFSGIPKTKSVEKLLGREKMKNGMEKNEQQHAKRKY